MPPAIPPRIKLETERRAQDHQAARWPQLREVRVRYRGSFAYVEATLPDGDNQPLFRLTWTGHRDQRWGFAVWLASKDGYERSVLPSGDHMGTIEEAMDCACGLYLNDPTAWRITR